MLNSATVTPLAATCGANMAAGYTTDDVPTWNEGVWNHLIIYERGFVNIQQPGIYSTYIKFVYFPMAILLAKDHLYPNYFEADIFHLEATLCLQIVQAKTSAQP